MIGATLFLTEAFDGGPSRSAREARSAGPARETHWIERLQRTGDPDLFAALVERFQGRVYRLVAATLGPEYAGDAEDATQEVFLHAYEKLSGFRGDSRFSTWLYRLARNRAIDYRRRLARRKTLPLLEESVEVAMPEREGSKPLDHALERERAASLHGKLGGLTRDQRTAVYLHYWLGCSVAEVAELTDRNPATIKSHLFRARQALARELRGAKTREPR